MGRWDTQSSDADNWVGVSSDGIDNTSGKDVASEFLIQQKGENAEHVHLGFDEDGNQLFEQRR